MILVLCSLVLNSFYIHEQDYAQYGLCGSGLYSRKIINMHFIDQMSGLVKNLNIGIYSDAIDVTSVKLCMMVQLIELYLFTLLFHSYSSAKQFWSSPVNLHMSLTLPAKLAHSFSFCSCVCFCLYCPFNCI